MSETKELSKMEQAERDLEEAIGSSEEPVAVLLSESWHPGSKIMVDRLHDLTRQGHHLRIIQLPFSSSRKWAKKHGAFGIPCLLLFQNGQMMNRLPGVVEEDFLSDFFAKFDGRKTSI
jgi:thioredoxin-like negative regulator of GroEL